MNCLDCQDLLQRRLDGDNVARSPALEQHLAGCLSCRQNHAAAELLLLATRSRARASLPGDFPERMAAAVLHDRLVRQRRTVLRWRIITGMAAAILVFTFIGQFLLPQPDHDPAP